MDKSGPARCNARVPGWRPAVPAIKQEVIFMDNASALPLSSWSAQLREQLRARPVIAIGLLVALAAVVLLLLQSLVMLAAGDISPGVRYGLLGGLAGFAATALGALPALFLRSVPSGWRTACWALPPA